MTYGLNVYDENGVLQVSSEDFALHMVAKGSFTFNGPRQSQTISFNSNYNPYIIVRAVSYTNDLTEIQLHGIVGIALTDKAGSTFTWKFRSGKDHPSGPVTNVEWYIFDRVDPSQIPHNYGLVVRNAAGEITFYNGLNPLKIVATYEVSDFSQNNKPPFPDLTRKYAFGMSLYISIASFGDGINYYYSVLGAVITNNRTDWALSFNEYSQRYSLPANERAAIILSSAAPRVNLLMVDVTDF